MMLDTFPIFPDVLVQIAHPKADIKAMVRGRATASMAGKKTVKDALLSRKERTGLWGYGGRAHSVVT